MEKDQGFQGNGLQRIEDTKSIPETLESYAQDMFFLFCFSFVCFCFVFPIYSLLSIIFSVESFSLNSEIFHMLIFTHLLPYLLQEIYLL